jgi:hypothetical protein
MDWQWKWGLYGSLGEECGHTKNRSIYTGFEGIRYIEKSNTA